ncbi:MAG: PHP domain-containing protein [Proteobacteria bacterium]|nr:PHP domain-containing protein [Desulfobacula sp.]MBU3951841.1 PHP domain-containing protein [Pseudomonadota bacterium]MBU4129333.1 PHP domain-containing protein [Pseudomonadota bacterium]
MKPKIIADLHNHTTASDGDYAPEKLVMQAKSLGLKALGITDHDSLQGLSKALVAGDDCQIEIIPGVEVSIRFKRPYFTGTLHLLCYFSRARLADDAFVQRFEAILAQGRGEGLVRARIARINQVFGPKGDTPLLKRDLGFQDIAHYSANATRRHFALALAERLGIDGRADVNRIIGNDSPAYLPSGIELSQGRDIIKTLPVVAVLAHPAAGSFPGQGHYKEVLPPLETVQQILPEFIEAGIRGLEVYYPGHTKEHEQILKSWAQTHGLFVTGGSDCHDATDRPIGVSGISESEFNLFKRAIP